MPQFVLDTSGTVERGQAYGGACRWVDLDAFTQGYIEALFFTSSDDLSPVDGMGNPMDGCATLGFSDLSPETLARIIEDCAKFQDAHGADLQHCDEMDEGSDGNSRLYPRQAGRDFWYTRNDHGCGCGFWDGDWPEPYATQLTEAAEAFGETDAYLGDDGLVYLP